MRTKGGEKRKESDRTFAEARRKIGKMTMKKGPETYQQKTLQKKNRQYQKMKDRT